MKNITAETRQLSLLPAQRLTHLPLKVTSPPEQTQDSEPKVFNRHHKNVPSDAVYIGRGSLWGNPFVIGTHGGRNAVCDLFEQLVERDPAFKQRAISSLKGRNLACYCKPARCHGDYLLRIANAMETGAAS